MTKDVILENKCNALLKMIQATREPYLQANYEEQAFIETVIGVAIFYLPKRTKRLWDGKISLLALEDFHPEIGINNKTPKLSEDHLYPRKYSAKKLLNEDWANRSMEDLMKYYLDELGRFTYVTPKQNKQLVKHQKEFKTPKMSYDNAGLSFIEISYEEIKLIKKRDKQTIEKYIDITSYFGI